MVSKFPDFISNLNRLVELPSISSANKSIDMSNGPVIDYLASAFSDLGFQCELVESPSNSDKKKTNLIATLGTGNGGLVLSGHTDTVPLDEDLWSVNPFKLTQKDNRLYGLGSTDMKGFFPVIMEAVKQLESTNLHEPLIVLATADEETSMQGARTLVEKGTPQGRFAVIGEPTGLIPVRAHKGIMMESIRLQGKSGHSSDPSLGNNALDAMYEVIGDLIQFRLELQQKYRNELFKIEYPTLNLGCIHGGDNPNRICGHCDLEIDVRVMPDMNIDNIRELITIRVAEICKRRGIEYEVVALFPGAPAFVADTDSKILAMVERLTGETGISVAFGTEAPHLQKLGMDTIVFGPGNIDQAHQPDEYMSLEMVKPGIGYIKQIIENACL